MNYGFRTSLTPAEALELAPPEPPEECADCHWELEPDEDECPRCRRGCTQEDHDATKADSDYWQSLDKHETWPWDMGDGKLADARDCPDCGSTLMMPVEGTEEEAA